MLLFQRAIVLGIKGCDTSHRVSLCSQHVAGRAVPQLINKQIQETILSKFDVIITRAEGAES